MQTVKQALIVVSHGSRHKESNAEVLTLVNALSAECEDNFTFVTHAFLEFSQPDITKAFDLVFEQGIKKVTVLPLFISAGKHVKKDIPLAIGNVLEKMPELEVELKPHLGSMQGITTLIRTIL